MASLTLAQVPVPDWARPYALSISADFGELNFKAICQHKHTILDTLHAALADYLDAVSPDQTFPDKAKLSGEYYIAAETYWVWRHPNPIAAQAPEYRFSFMAHLLQTESPIVDRDYLGLEVHFVWDDHSRQVVFYGDIDASSI